MSERNEVSAHEVRFFLAAKGAVGWITAAELAMRAEIAPRTARAFAQKFVDLGLFDRAEVFPAHRFRLAAKAGKRNAAYVQRLERAVEVFAGTTKPRER